MCCKFSKKPAVHGPSRLNAIERAKLGETLFNSSVIIANDVVGFDTHLIAPLQKSAAYIGNAGISSAVSVDTNARYDKPEPAKTVCTIARS